MQKMLGMFVAGSLVSLFCLFMSVGTVEAEGVSQLDVAGFKDLLAENEGKVVLVNFWSPF
ncbi:MAG: hypothetical protein V3V45_05885 [Candidatus Brocadiales bacterium]